MDEFNGKTVDLDAERMIKKAKVYVPLFIVVAIVGILLFNSIYFLDQAYNAVVLRFGQVNRVETQAGMQFKMPFIETVRKVNVEQIYSMEYGYRTNVVGQNYVDVPDEATIIVDGSNNNASIALIELVIQYRVTSPVDFLFRVDDVEGTLRLALEEAIRSSVQAYTLDQAKTQKELIDEDILPRLQMKMNDYESGITVTLVGTQNVQFLDSVEAAYQQKENANQYKNSKQEEAERYYNTVIPQAQATAKQIVEEAYGYRATVIADANASVAEFNALYDEYLNYPDILKETYYIDAMALFIRNNDVVVDLTNDGDIYKFYNFEQNLGVQESLINDGLGN